MVTSLDNTGNLHSGLLLLLEMNFRPISTFKGFAALDAISARFAPVSYKDQIYSVTGFSDYVLDSINCASKLIKNTEV